MSPQSRVYFTASTSADPVTKSAYTLILKALTRKARIISGQQIVDASKLRKDQKLTPAQIFLRQKKLIDQCDFVCAEVTHAQAGVGGEIVYALTKEKPVLALVLEGSDRKLTPMLAGNPSDQLYKAYYRTDNLTYIISDFIKHIHTSQKRKGKFIVIEGGDGSGKATQAKLLVDHLQKKGIDTRYYDFPRYYTSFHGEIVARFLRSEFGKIDQVSPYLISLAYALDRAAVRQEMEDFLARGGWIVSNRYTSASMGHQMSKIKDPQEKLAFLDWLYTLEYKIHKIPHEDRVVYLHVAPEVSAKLIIAKGERAYTKGKKKDLQESNLIHQKESEASYLWLTKRFKHWRKVECMKGTGILPVASIHKKVLQSLTGL